MRIILIVIGLAAAVWWGLKSFGSLADGSGIKKSMAEKQALKGEVPKPPRVSPPSPAPAAANPQAPAEELQFPVVQVPAESYAVYIFANRTAPPAPFAMSVSTDKQSSVSVDPGANAWVMRGSPSEVEMLKAMAKALDVASEEIDLDFVLVAVSEQWLDSIGLSVLFNEGASYLSAFSLDGSGGSLRLSSGNVAVSLTYQDASESVALVAAPVVRCMTGDPFSFSNDTELPVPSLARSEGVVTSGVDYRSVGLGITGTVRALPGGSYRLVLEQRNGTIGKTVAVGGADVPQAQTQTLKTSVVVERDRWSCAGGVRTSRTITRKRLLGKSEEQTEDLLLVFVRARSSLELTPRAFPVDMERPETANDLPFEPSSLDHPLLPPMHFKTKK